MVLIFTLFTNNKTLSNDTLSTNYLIYGFDKQINNTVFNNDLNYLLNSEFGNINFNHNYYAEHYLTADNFKENEILKLNYIKDYDLIKLLINNNLDYNSNNIDKTGLANKLENSSLIGFALSTKYLTKLELNTGIQYKQQLDTNSFGSTSTGKLLIDIDDLYSLKSNLNVDANYTKHNFDRNNYTINLYNSYIKTLSLNDNIQLNFLYNLNNIDFLRKFENFDTKEIYKKENRNDEIYTLNTSINTKLIDHLYSNFDLSFNDRTIISDLELSNNLINEKTKKNIFNSRIRNKSYFENINFYSSLEFEYHYNKLENNLIDSSENSIIEERIKRSDNISSQTNLGFDIIYKSNRDTISMNLQFEKFIYDSPSNQTHDDRDEITTKLDLSYKHVFSNNLTGSINAKFWGKHYVYIKAQQSASNRWNRVINFNPNFHWNTKYFEYFPGLEIIANYTVYDFKTTAQNYSNRELNYKDSLKIYMTKNTYIQTNFYYRFFIDGLLNWENFSEKVIKTNVDNIFRLRLFHKLDNDIFSLGIRVYNQNRIDELSKKSKLLDYEYKVYTIGPETSIEFNFENYKFILSGWLEYKYINDKFIDYNSYLYINSYIRL